jgi:hypothetical protein
MPAITSVLAAGPGRASERATYSAYAAAVSSRFALQSWPHVVHTQVAPALSESDVTVASTVWHRGQSGVRTGGAGVGMVVLDVMD